MKKIVVFLLIATICFVSGCGSLGSGGATSTTRSSDITSNTGSSSSTSISATEPQELKYRAYEVYFSDATDNNTLLASVVEIGKTKLAIGKTEIEEGVEAQQFLIGNIQTSGSYFETYWQIFQRARRTRIFNTVYGWVETDAETNEIVKFNFKTSELIDMDKTEKTLTQGQCKEIALNFLSSIGFDPTAQSYVFTETELYTVGKGQPYCKNYYNFFFKKKIDGIDTTDTCSIGVTEYGSIIYYRRGDSFVEEELAALNVDYERAEAAATRYATDICKVIRAKNAVFEVKDPTYLLLEREVYALEYGIYIEFMDEVGDKKSGAIGIIIPLEDG